MFGTNLQRMGGRRYARYIVHHAKKNNVLVLLAAIFIAGVACGTFMVRSAGNDTVSALFSLVNGFIENRRGQTVLQNFISASLSSLTFIGILFVCGFCAISQPAVIFAPFFRGLGFGFAAASLYLSYGASAIGFIALLIIPDMLASSIAILLCCRESLRLSGNFWGLMWDKGKDGLYPLKIYFGRYVAASILCIISAFLEAVLYLGFANRFVLG